MYIVYIMYLCNKNKNNDNIEFYDNRLLVIEFLSY